jgi:hypothetical protein
VREIDRRLFLTAAGGVLLWPALRAGAQDDSPAEPPAEPKPLDPKLRKELETSEFVYVSPLKSDGEESHCHGEVWFGLFDGGAVLITSTQSWKVRALVRGLDRARVWVGSYGRWKRVVGFNESFRKATSFEARAQFVRDDALLEQLLSLFDTKYPDEIGRWRTRMKDDYYAGKRVLIRYTPV